MKTHFLTLASIFFLIIGCNPENLEEPNCTVEATIHGLGSACYDFSLTLNNGTTLNTISAESVDISFDLKDGLKVMVSYEEDPAYIPTCFGIFEPDTKWIRISCITLLKNEGGG